VAGVFEDLARKRNGDQRYCSPAGDWPRPALMGQAAREAAASGLNLVIGPLGGSSSQSTDLHL
jgi:hypothetical protein